MESRSRPPRIWAFALLLPTHGIAAAQRPEDVEFKDSRLGDVPSGVADQFTPETEKAIERGLAWLGKQANSNGSFSRGDVPVAVTSLAGLALLASGSTPDRGPYGPQVEKAVKYILDQTDSSAW
ncbi:MAG: hypothetical protein U0800_25375 [Isosphaeraceae bacterium]